MYATRRRPRAIVLDDYEHGPASTAGEIIDSDDAIDTGLLDASGSPLYRVREPIRLGFEKGQR